MIETEEDITELLTEVDKLIPHPSGTPAVCKQAYLGAGDRLYLSLTETPKPKTFKQKLGRFVVLFKLWNHRRLLAKVEKLERRIIAIKRKASKIEV